MKFRFKSRTLCTLLALYIVLLNTLCIPCSASSYAYYTNKLNPNYTTTHLDNLYNTSGSTTASWESRIYDQGCFVTSYAMILKNLGQTTVSEVADVRYSLTTESYLEADPFTVTYANADFPSISYNSSSGKYYASYTGDPVDSNPYVIADNFDVTYGYVDLRNSSESSKAFNLAYYINEYPQGVAIYFYDSVEGTHLIVGVDSSYPISRSTEEIVPVTVVTSKESSTVDDSDSFASSDIVRKNNTKTTSTDMTYGSYFTVCDPVSYTGTPGENVPMDESWTATEFDFNDILYLRLFY